MNMYSVKPFGQFDIKPTEILYKMPSYHGEEDHMETNGNATNDSTIESQVSPFEELLRETVNLTENFAKHVLSYINSHYSSTVPTSSEDLSQGKPATKKEKTAGNEKQKKQPTPVKAEKSAKVEEPHLLPIGMNDVHYRGQAQFHFKLQKYELVNKKLEVTAGKNYSKIVQLLKAAADGRGVGSNVVIKEKAENGLSAIVTTSEGTKENLDDATKILMTFGEICGVYSHHDRRLDQTSEWLAVANDILNKNQPLDPVIRSMSQHLGALDLLHRTPGVTLTDLVMFSVVEPQKALPNNVELFVNRISEAVSRA